MNRFIRKLCILMFFVCTAAPLCAQNGLNVGTLFGGKYGKQDDATEVFLRGKKISSYDLTLFRSLMLNASATNVQTIERLVKGDGQNAIDKEVTLRGGKIHFALYQLKPKGKLRRYIFYRNDGVANTKSLKPKLTLIYMEGTASIDALKRSFSK